MRLPRRLYIGNATLVVLGSAIKPLVIKLKVVFVFSALFFGTVEGHMGHGILSGKSLCSQPFAIDHIMSNIPDLF